MALTPEQQELADKLTNLQRGVVLGVVAGKSYEEAYADAKQRPAKNAETARAIVSRMLTDVNVRAFYDSLVAVAAGEAQITLKTLLEELEEARQAAMLQEKPQAAAMVAATMGKAKLLGLEAPSKVELTGANGGPVKMKTLNDFYDKEDGQS
jgi:phage terminase small subunit